jgi:hypothetical protein
MPCAVNGWSRTSSSPAARSSASTYWAATAPGASPGVGPERRQGRRVTERGVAVDGGRQQGDRDEREHGVCLLERRIIAGRRVLDSCAVPASHHYWLSAPWARRPPPREPSPQGRADRQGRPPRAGPVGRRRYVDGPKAKGKPARVSVVIEGEGVPPARGGGSAGRQRWTSPTRTPSSTTRSRCRATTASTSTSTSGPRRVVHVPAPGHRARLLQHPPADERVVVVRDNPFFTKAAADGRSRSTACRRVRWC